MTRIHFLGRGNQLFGFELNGHAGYADYGQDIVCAAITSAVRLTECILNDSMNCHPETVLEEGSIKLTLPDSELDAAQSVLNGLSLYFSELAKEYPQEIQILEV